MRLEKLEAKRQRERESSRGDIGNSAGSRSSKKAKYFQTSAEACVGLVGVRVHAPSGKYYAWLRNGGKYVHIGAFDDEISAAKAYDTQAASLGLPLNFHSEKKKRCHQPYRTKVVGT